MVTVRKPATRKPAPPAKRTAAAPTKREVAKSAPAPRKAAAARPASEAKKEQLAGARAARSAHIAEVKEAATKGVDVHPVKKQEVTAHDVLRARHTYEVLYSQWLQQQGEELSEVLDFVAPIMNNAVGAPKKSPQTRAKVAPEERVIGEFYDRDDIEKYSLKELRELATDLVENGVPGMTEKVKKTVILAQMEKAGLFREDGSADADEDDIEDDVDEDAEEDVEDDDEESADDDDEDETEDVVYDRDDLKAMSLKELQELAEANEYDWKGLGKAALIDALLADDEEEEESEEEEDDDDVVGIDPDELPNMDLDELLDLCKQIELKVPVAKRKNKKAVIQMILEELGDEEDDE